MKPLPDPGQWVERFWKNVDKTSEPDCWIWTAARMNTGYGVLRIQGALYLAHRLAYRLATGDDPGRLLVDHKCHQRACINPAHLRLATRKQNAENHYGGPNRNNVSSGMRGAYRGHNLHRWDAKVEHDGQSIYVGSYGTAEEAAEAARVKRIELHQFNDRDRTVAIGHL